MAGDSFYGQNRFILACEITGILLVIIAVVAAVKYKRRLSATGEGIGTALQSPTALVI